jgi:hypothetical protein
MATSYLTNAQKVSISSVIDNIHETFARTITCYKDGERVSLATNSQYNSYYHQQSSNTEFSEVSLEIQARIRYVKADEDLFSFKDGGSAHGNQNKVALPAGSVKIKVDRSGHEFIRDTKRIELDGNRYAIVSNARQIAMFGPDYSPYYEYILTPTDEP